MKTKTQRGFTLVELMVVIAVIALLAAALLPNLLAASEQQNIADTTARMLQLQAGIESFERQFDVYPPDDFKSSAPEVLVMDGKADRVNAGIESLMVALHLKRVRGGVTMTDNKTWLANTDKDDYGQEILLLGGTAKLEVVDAWGTPIVYFQGDLGPKRRQRVMLPTGEEVDAKVWVDKKTDKPIGFLKGWQLISAGGDMMFNTDDDITIPERGIIE